MGNQTHQYSGSTVVRQIDYNAIGKASRIRSFGSEADSGRSAGETRFTYDGSRNQVRRHSTEQGNTSTLIQQGGTELIIEGSERRFRRNLGNAIVERSGNNITTRYVYTDHLGSVDVITNAAGQLLEKLSFDAFGKRRAVFTSSGQSIALNLTTLLAITHQGFTGHQQVDHAGIVQMGGRIYDSHIGRFLQADPFVQSPSNSQNFNRYSYVLNNPLSYTDPSGYLFKKLLSPGHSISKRVQRTFFKAIGPEASNLLVGIASMGCGVFAPACAAYGSYQVQRAHGATPEQARKGAAITGASVWAFQQIGGYYQGQSANNLAANTSGTHTFGRLTLTSGQIAGQITAHAMVGGVAASLQGGKFGHGFLAAGFAKGLGTHLNDHYGHDIVAGTATSAVVGGTASVIAGGKFANGAVTAAFQALYNHYSRPSLTGGLSPEEYLEQNWESGQLSFDLQVGNDYVQFDGSKLSGSYSLPAGPGFSIDSDGKITFDLGAGFSSKYVGARGGVFADSTGRAGMQGQANLGPLRATASYSSNVGNNWQHLKVVISEVLYADANRGPNIRHGN